MNLLRTFSARHSASNARAAARLLRGIRAERERLESFSDAQLAERYADLRDGMEFETSSQFSDETLLHAFALGLDALRRKTGMLAYDVQLLAGLAMARGSVAEMQTGEGKTLTTMFPIVAFALSRSGVHVATVNGYLANRDCEFLAPALRLLGISVGMSHSDDSADEKRQAYACDVTFATGYDLGFDFLRDQIATRKQVENRLGSKLRRDLFSNPADVSPQMQRGFAAAIVDELDSVFIDEAITPLVLSSGTLGAVSGAAELGAEVDGSVYRMAQETAAHLVEGEDFMIDSSAKSLTLTEQGSEAAHRMRDLAADGGHHLFRPWRLYVESALRAQYMMIRDINYVVRNDAIEIVDEYTGRIFSDRNWRDGLHQAVEAKESVSFTEERTTIAKISRQRYFQRYATLCGMTGTADGHQHELRKCYGLDVVIIPRRKKLLREEVATRYFKTQADKIEFATINAIHRSQNGQPVLIGTRTIGQSHLLAAKFAERDAEYQVLNGVQDGDESSLIAQAGNSGLITVATNMAGRGTDIKLCDGSISAGGLHVIGFERNSSARIDRQLIGRSGRQGDPGSCQFLVAADDDMVGRFDGEFAKVLGRIRNSGGVESKSFDRCIKRIQALAEKAGYEARQQVMREELWTDKVKKTAG